MIVHTIMRIPLKESDDFSNKINNICTKISEKFFTTMKPKIEMNDINVMLRDCTITRAGTFDIKNVRDFYRDFLKSLMEYGWKISDILSSNNDDLYRLYFQISKDVNKFRIYGYFGIQYHVLSYYKIDKRILEIKKEINLLEEKIIQNTNKISNVGDELIKTELENLGYKDLSVEGLLSTIFDNNEIMMKLEEKIQNLENKIPENNEFIKTKDKLISELSEMIIKLNNILPNCIDYNKLMQGEVGVICYFDIETIINKFTRQTDSYINIKGLNQDDMGEIINNFETIHKILDNYSI